MSTRNVIIFGATGAVGSTAALTAYKEGAKVSLAMRDPTKHIPKLDNIPAQRVQADLTKPDTVQEAVRQTGATIAYIYAVFETQDYLRGTIQALKNEGVEFVLFLGSAGVTNDPREVPESDFVANLHAKIEVNLEEVFGAGSFTVLRPGFFASNLFWFKKAMENGEVPLPLPESQFDYIAPDDIGRVSGFILANGSDQQVVRLYGASLRSFKNAFSVIGNALGKEVKTTKVPLEEAYQKMVANGVNEVMSDICVKTATAYPSGDFPLGHFSEGPANIRKFTHQEPMTLESWVEANKDQFAA